jgi:hypothetical protein
MKVSPIFSMLAIVGIGLMTGAIYVQSLTMDLNKYTVWQYFSADFFMPEWWAAIAAPFGVGFTYICIAIASMRLGPTIQTTIRIFTFCIVVAILLRFANSALGDIAMISTATLFLIAQWSKKNKLKAT